MHNFMRNISPSLKAKVVNHDFYEVVQKQKVFGYDQRILDQVLRRLEIDFGKPGSFVIRQNERNSRIVLLTQGFIEVFKSLDGQELTYDSTLTAGAMFGEVSCVLQSRCDETAICKNYCKLGYLSKQSYDEIKAKYPSLEHQMKKQINSYMINPTNNFFMSHYKKISIFANLTKQNARELSFHSYVQRYQMNQDIVAPGDLFKQLYIVMQGTVGVYITLKTGEEMFTDFLGVGSIIGQYSMIEGDGLMIGFRAVSKDCLMLQIQRESLEHFASQNEQMKAILNDAKAEVDKNGVNPFDFIRFNHKSDSERNASQSLIHI